MREQTNRAEVYSTMKITARDYFAITIMREVVGNGQKIGAGEIGRKSYAAADIMMRERRSRVDPDHTVEVTQRDLTAVHSISGILKNADNYAPECRNEVTEEIARMAFDFADELPVASFTYESVAEFSLDM